MRPEKTGGLGVVFRKEMLEVTRDRRTLMFMIAMPLLLIPLVLQLTADFFADAAKKAEKETISYVVFGGEHLPELAPALKEAKAFEPGEVDSIDAVDDAIRAETIKVALIVVPPEEGLQQATVELHYDNTATTSKVKKRTKSVLDDVAESIRRRRLTELGAEGFNAQQAVLEPVVVTERGTGSMREKIGEALGGMLPYMIIPFCFLGALYPAIDLGAGEKERGTLETLLLAPVSRAQLVLGKFLVVFTTGVVAATLSLVSIGGWAYFKGSALSGEFGAIIGSIATLDLVLVWTMLLPLTAMFAAVLLSISIYAKSFKEAQSYAAPFNFVAILPALLAMLPGVELNWKWGLVPVTNIALAIKELLKGTIEYSALLAILGSSTVVAGALLFFCTKWFQRESVLFRQ